MDYFLVFIMCCRAVYALNVVWLIDHALSFDMQCRYLGDFGVWLALGMFSSF